MMKKYIVYIILLTSLSSLHSQKANYYKRLFIDAEYYVLFGEYIEALPLYIEIYGVQQNNMNIVYRIGECYLNIPNEKNKSILYLEKAAKNISKEYKAGFFTEKSAPIEAFYQLGIAYRIDNKLDDAIEAFKTYKTFLDKLDNFNIELANHQIEICNNAKNLISQPIEIEISNVGKSINSSFANIQPVVSNNDSMMAFTSQLRFYDAVFFTRWINNRWIPASNITPYLGTDGDLNTCSISPDGKTLYFNRQDWDDYNIYISKYENRVWGNIIKLDRVINSVRYNEMHACISNDGKTLYFTSDREGGFGGYDIYRSKLTEDGKWGEPENLGAKINTKYDEATPFITEDKILFFSSQGHYNMGGFDIFTSEESVNKNWETPKNIGYPLNTTDDNIHFMPINNGKAGYISLFRKDGFGENDIYRIDFLTHQ